MSELTKVTDKAAIEALNNSTKNRGSVTNMRAPRTILYGVEIEYKKGILTTEVRTFIRQGHSCSESQWEVAQELEKQFPDLNKIHADALKKAGKPLNKKYSSNWLNASPVN